MSGSDPYSILKTELAGRIDKAVATIGLAAPEVLVAKIENEKQWARDYCLANGLDVAKVDAATFDLSVKNPNAAEEVTHRSPQEIMDEIAALDLESAEVLAKIRELV